MTINIYLGSREITFIQFITKLLSRSVKPKYMNILTNESSMRLYGQAFTASSADPKDNYERFEQLGDVSANAFIVWYAYRRFPQLDCTEGVKVVARLKINYGAKETFAPLAEKLGFWEFISAAEEGEDKGMKYRSRHKKDLLEDTFESFVGCTEYILDKYYNMPGVGYGVVYTILASIFDELPISLRFEDLFDAKTRLKETFDAYSQLGGWVFIDTREEVQDNAYTIANSILYQAPPGTNQKPLRKKTGPGQRDFQDVPQYGWVKLGEGSSSKKGEAQQRAAEKGIQYLRAVGFYRQPPEEYKFFCNS